MRDYAAGNSRLRVRHYFAMTLLLGVSIGLFICWPTAVHGRGCALNRSPRFPQFLTLRNFVRAELPLKTEDQIEGWPRDSYTGPAGGLYSGPGGGLFTPDLVVEHTPDQEGGFTPVRAVVFTLDLGEGFTPVRAVVFTLDRAVVFTPDLVAAYTPGQVAAFTPDLVEAYTPDLVQNRITATGLPERFF